MDDLIEARTELAYRLLRNAWVSALELAGVDQDGDAERCVLENTLRELIADAHADGRLR